MHIVLVEPEIPGNTGNISRLCAANHLVLHLVKPLGFSIDDKHLKRAGLDYWDLLEVHIHENYQALVEYLKGRRFWFNTTKAEKSYTGRIVGRASGAMHSDSDAGRSSFIEFIERGGDCFVRSLASVGFSHAGAKGTFARSERRFP